MSHRSVRVLHVVVPRRVGDTTEVLLYPHPTWRDPHTGNRVLALPTTKLAGAATADSVPPRLSAVLEGDLGLPAVATPPWQPLAETRLTTVSPTHNVASEYFVSAVLTRLPLASHGRAARAVRGEWVSPADALGLADLSPTARAVLERAVDRTLLPEPPAPAFGSAEERVLTALLTAARDGDMNKFGQFVERVRAKFTAQLRAYRLNRASSAEDVFGDAVVRALEKLDLFDPTRGTASTWLWTIAFRTAVSGQRHEKKSKELSEGAAAALVSREFDPGTLVSGAGAIAALQDRLAAALKASPRLVRRAWELRVDDGLQYDAVADALGVPKGTVATWIYKIRQKALGPEADPS